MGTVPAFDGHLTRCARRPGTRSVQTPGGGRDRRGGSTEGEGMTLDFVYHPDRLLTPLRRVGPQGSPGRREPISWDGAIGEIASRWRRIIDRHGAAAILPHSFSGTTGWVNLGLSNHRLWNRMRASGLQRSICNAVAYAGRRGTAGGAMVIVSNERGECRLRAVVSAAPRPGPPAPGRRRRRCCRSAWRTWWSRRGGRRSHHGG